MCSYMLALKLQHVCWHFLHKRLQGGLFLTDSSNKQAPITLHCASMLKYLQQDSDRNLRCWIIADPLQWAPPKNVLNVKIHFRTFFRSVSPFCKISSLSGQNWTSIQYIAMESSDNWIVLANMQTEVKLGALTSMLFSVHCPHPHPPTHQMLFVIDFNTKEWHRTVFVILAMFRDKGLRYYCCKL